MFELAGIDQTLILPEFVYIELVRKPFPVNGFPIDDANADINKELSKAKSQDTANAIASSIDAKTKLLLSLQFPPRITTDSKSADWQLEPLATYEPLAIFMGSSARKISIDLTYIVGAGTDQNVTFEKNGNDVTRMATDFSASKIGLICNQIKAYFYRSIQASSIPIVRIKFYNHVGAINGAAVFRLNDVNISHGDTIIKDDTGVFPLLTKIVLNAELTTQSGGKQGILGLPVLPFRDWY